MVVASAVVGGVLVLRWLGLGAASIEAAPTGAPMTDPVASAAAAFLEALEPAQLGRARLPFGADARTDWHYVPRGRPGVDLGDLAPRQRRAFDALLAAGLSEAGTSKVRGVFHLEEVIGRDPGAYTIAVFGSPGGLGPWGWRVEGHHLSLHWTDVDRKLAVTPSFLGAQPAEERSGPRRGRRLLAAEEDLGRALLDTLRPDQRKRAVLSDRAPRDIVTGADRRVRLDRFEGLPGADMDAPQRAALVRLVRVYVDRMRPDLAAAQWERVASAGVERLHFAWAGSSAAGAGRYYRVHGPTLLIEWDDTQGGANHVHTVWRDPSRDFGDDLLEHYRTSPHHAGDGAPNAGTSDGLRPSRAVSRTRSNL